MTTTGSQRSLRSRAARAEAGLPRADHLANWTAAALEAIMYRLPDDLRAEIAGIVADVAHQRGWHDPAAVERMLRERWGVQQQ